MPVVSGCQHCHYQLWMRVIDAAGRECRHPIQLLTMPLPLSPVLYKQSIHLLFQNTRLYPCAIQYHFATVQIKMAIVKSEQLLREKFRKRKTNRFKKADELARMTQSKIYIVVQHGDRYNTYQSTDKPNWPPRENEMVS